jgi:hypothetical protein
MTCYFARALARDTFGLIVAAIVALPGCAGPKEADAEPLCLSKPADATCTDAAYGVHDGVLMPTFSDVFNGTLKGQCTQAGCHGSVEPQNGLELDVEATAYTDLLGENAAHTEARVIPRNVTCGELIVRLETANESWSMPQGGHLTDQELCAIRHWIADGAPQ